MSFERPLIHSDGTCQVDVGGRTRRFESSPAPKIRAYEIAATTNGVDIPVAPSPAPSAPQTSALAIKLARANVEAQTVLPRPENGAARHVAALKPQGDPRFAIPASPAKPAATTAAAGT